MANAVGSDARQQRIHDLEVMTKFNQRAMQYAKGTLVQFNLKNNSDLNGKVGTIIDQNGMNGRLRVQVHGTTTNQVLQVKKENVLIACYEPTPAEIAKTTGALAPAEHDPRTDMYSYGDVQWQWSPASTAGFNLPDAASPESAAMTMDILAADTANPMAQRVLAMMNQTSDVASL